MLREARFRCAVTSIVDPERFRLLDWRLKPDT